MDYAMDMDYAIEEQIYINIANLHKDAVSLSGFSIPCF